MRSINKILTFDGVEHDNTKDATRHLDKMYGEEITKHAHKLAGKKYVEISSYLDEHIKEFAYAIRIKNDMQYTEE